MRNDNIFLQVSCVANPNIGIIEVDPVKGINKELLETILEEHFDTKCEVVEIINANDINTFTYNATAKIDMLDDSSFQERICFERTFVYRLN